MSSEKLVAAMGKYNDELVKAGVLAAEGLQPSAKGAEIRYADGKRTIIDGPFAEAKELIAGFWMIQVKSREEAIEWAKRVPFEAGAPGRDRAAPGLRDVRLFTGALPVRRSARGARFRACVPRAHRKGVKEKTMRFMMLMIPGRTLRERGGSRATPA